MQTDEPHHSAAAFGRSTSPRRSERTKRPQALRNGPIGALVVASIAVGLLFIGWLAFYFLLFMPRGPIG